MPYPSPALTRLFSHIELNGTRFVHQPGSLIGAIALVAGTTVGAGILALPAVTLQSGVLPSTAILIGAWVYMVIAGLLLAEVNLHVIRQLGRPGLGLLATARYSLGELGGRAFAVLHAFKHYLLLMAYMTRGGDEILAAIRRVELLPDLLPDWSGAGIFTLLFGSMVYLGSDRFVSRVNNFLVLALVGTFVGLLLLIGSGVQPSQWLHYNWQAVSAAIPVMFVALVYHSVVPVITTQLEGDLRKIRWAIILGSALPLGMFVLWNALILGSIGPEWLTAEATEAMFDPLQILQDGDARHGIGTAIALFSEFAVLTSFIGFVYGLLNFFGDVLEVHPRDEQKRSLLYLLVLAPPLAFSFFDPRIFFRALDYAGAFGVSVLFGIIPALMAWRQRYRPSAEQPKQQAVPGGRVVLTIMIGIAVSVMVQQVLVKVGVL